jgi:hypothetical protein
VYGIYIVQKIMCKKLVFATRFNIDGQQSRDTLKHMNRFYEQPQTNCSPFIIQKVTC